MPPASISRNQRKNGAQAYLVPAGVAFNTDDVVKKRLNLLFLPTLNTTKEVEIDKVVVQVLRANAVKFSDKLLEFRVIAVDGLARAKI